MILGLDVGVDQGVISLLDWRKIRSEGRRFAFYRCMEGLGSVDPTFASNVAGGTLAGLAGGAYFVLHPWLDVVAQVTAWFDASKRLGCSAGQLAPVIDIELDKDAGKTMAPGDVLAALIACANKIALLWQRPPIVYTYLDFEKRDVLGGGDPTPLAASALWLASYEPTPPAAPAPWSQVTWWQQSGGSGYRTPAGAPCDSDAFLGSEGDFAVACDPLAEVVVPLSVETT